MHQAKVVVIMDHAFFLPASCTTAPLPSPPASCPSPVMPPFLCLPLLPPPHFLPPVSPLCLSACLSSSTSPPPSLLSYFWILLDLIIHWEQWSGILCALPPSFKWEVALHGNMTILFFFFFLRTMVVAARSNDTQVRSTHLSGAVILTKMFARISEPGGTAGDAGDTPLVTFTF